MEKNILVLIALVFTVSFSIQESYGLNDYDLISEWGSFGIAKPGFFSHPQSVAVDNDGNVYITDLGNKRIQKLSSTGQFLIEWGTNGKQVGEFHYPSGIAVDEKYVYVSDRDLHKVQKFDHDGNFVLEWGQHGTKEGQFKFPNGVLVSNNFVYVVDTGNHRIQKFTLDGKFVLSFGSSGIHDAQFLTAVDIDDDIEGNLYITDRGNGKIEKFDSDGNHMESFKYSGRNYSFSPEGISVDSDGSMFVINTANNRILHLSPDSSYLDIFEQKGPYPDKFQMPYDLAFGINGELFVVDSGKNKITVLETSHTKVTEPTQLGNITNTKDTLKPTLFSPPDMVVDATDFLTHVNIGKPVTYDASGIKTITNNAPDEFPLGITTIMWISFDNAGNSNHSFQNITINACGRSYLEYNGIYGSANDDFIEGTDLDDLIFALDGNDLIDGKGGNDCIFGGSGDDIINGNGGDDIINGNGGNDIIKGYSDNDILYGDEGQDIVDGGVGIDNCHDKLTDVLINCES